MPAGSPCSARPGRADRLLRRRQHVVPRGQVRRRRPRPVHRSRSQQRHREVRRAAAAIDRLTSGPTVLESQFGVRMVLSSDKRDSKAPPIDDLAKADPQVPTEAGKVRVLLEGVADLTATVTLIDAETRRSIGELKPEIAPPDPSRIQGGAQFQPDPKLPAGTLDVEVTGGPGQVQDPLKGIAIRIVPASAKDASTGGFESATAADGTVRMALKVTEPQR